MKKILFILLLVSNFCFGQITITEVRALATTCGQAVFSEVTNITLTAGKLYFYVVWEVNIIGTLSSSDGNNWETVAQVGGNAMHLQVYRFMPTTTTTTDDVRITWASPYSQSSKIILYEIENAQTGSNGANAIRQVVTDSANAADPDITMAALGQRNAVITFWINNQNGFGGTPESGWSELYDSGCVYPVGFYVMDRITTNDNTPTVTAASSDWKGIAVELIQTGRRVTLIN